MTDDQEVLSRPLLAGRRCIAEYIDPLLPSYQGNPLIEALPELYEPEQVARLLTVHPIHKEIQRSWPSHVRKHCVEQISEFIQPLSQHVKFEEAISRLIWHGYVGRNPLDPSYARQFVVGFQNIRQVGLDDQGRNVAGITPTSQGLVLIGVSGIGKSTAINSILKQLYPQVIQHTRYKDRQLILKQLVWLKLECPASGSLKVLCQNFFRQVDLALGTNSYKEHVKSHSTKETMLDPMAQIAARQGLGVLVIDEIQRLKLAKNSGEREVLAYLTEFVNTIGVPVVLIGTYSSLYLFNSVFAEARRASGQVDPIWSPIPNNRTWEFFMEELWQFQWTREIIPLTKELRDVFYDESQGITDIAVKLYKAVQWEVIGRKDREGREREEISATLVKQTAKKYLKLVEPLLDALKKGDTEKLRKIPDLKPDWSVLNDYLKDEQLTIELQGVLAEDHARVTRQKQASNLLVELMDIGTELGLPPEQSQTLAQDIIQASDGMADPTLMKKQMAKVALAPELGQTVAQSDSQVVDIGTRKAKTKTKPMMSSTDPWKPVLDAIRDRSSVREALLQVGFLKPPSEFNV